MHYWKYSILTESPDLSEILIAFLAEAPFDTFEENEAGFDAYTPAKEGNTVEAELHLQDLSEQFEFQWTKEYIPGQNWNEIWESNFHPVIVRDWCAIRADFHPPSEGVQHELVINPKMAFGTGHHETTWMCLSALQTLPVQNSFLLDYGCGTGVLAILAARLGARCVEAVDIESESYLNTVENAQRNGVSEQIIARLGTLDQVEGTGFDGILANINRHIILDSMQRLFDLLRPGGWVLFSGILSEDETVVVPAAEAVGFGLKHIERKGKWLCIEMGK